MGRENFSQNAGRDIARRSEANFGGATPRRGGEKGWSRSDARSNKQRFELISDQTNNREQTNKNCGTDQINLSDKQTF
jgi:hypothetical protein